MFDEPIESKLHRSELHKSTRNILADLGHVRAFDLRHTSGFRTPYFRRHLAAGSYKNVRCFLHRLLLAGIEPFEMVRLADDSDNAFPPKRSDVTSTTCPQLELAGIDLAQESCLKYQHFLTEASPKKLHVEIKYRLPEEMFVNRGLAGAGSEANHKQAAIILVLIRALPTQGRRAVLLEAA